MNAITQSSMKHRYVTRVGLFVKNTGLAKSDRYSINSNSSSDIAIDISNLTKRFENITALDNLSLAVKYGEIFGLLGPNGSGKTTTINIVSGLSKPTYGQVKVLGYDITQNTHTVHAVLGAVPQETALYYSMELDLLTNATVVNDALKFVSDYSLKITRG